MKSIKNLREELTSVFAAVKGKKIDLPRAKALVATGNTIMKTVKMEMDQNKFLNKKKEIDFLK